MNGELETMLAQATKRVYDSATLAIVLPATPGLDVIALAHALASGLRAIGKIVSVFAPPLEPAGEKPHALALWNAPAADQEPLREFILSFDLARSPIKELKYERAENRLDIILSPTGRIRREDVEFRWGELRYDLAIVLGARTAEMTAPSLRSAPELIHEKPILNIDANPSNLRYGEVNLVPAEGADPAESGITLAELISGLLSSLGVPPNDPERSSALFASLVIETGGFRPERTGATAFRLAGELRSQGADPALCRRLAACHAPGYVQLAGRAIARSRVDSKLDLLWAILTADDFLKTAVSPAAMEDLPERILAAVPQAGRVALLWQHPDDGMVRPLLRSAGGEDAPADMPEAAFPSFAAAEEHIRRLLTDTGGVE